MDLNFMVGDGRSLRRVIELLLAFRDHFALDLSAAKTKIWGNRVQEVQDIASEYGLGCTESLEALGASWQIPKNVFPAFQKEISRLRKMELRIRRLKPLPVPFLTKCDLASMSCLSLLDYVNHPKCLFCLRPKRAPQESSGTPLCRPRGLIQCHIEYHA